MFELYYFLAELRYWLLKCLLDLVKLWRELYDWYWYGLELDNLDLDNLDLGV